MNKRNYMYSYAAVLASVIAAGLGLYLQSISEESIALARAGSVIVCIGISSIFLDLRTILSQIEKAYAEYPYGRSIMDLTEGLEVPVTRAKKEAELERLSANNPKAALDVIIVLSGTLLWGFGDLLI